MKYVEKHKHKTKFRFNHDIIPADWSLGFTFTISNNASFWHISLDAHFARHMWHIRIMKQKGYFYTYD